MCFEWMNAYTHSCCYWAMWLQRCCFSHRSIQLHNHWPFTPLNSVLKRQKTTRKQASVSSFLKLLLQMRGFQRMTSAFFKLRCPPQQHKVQLSKQTKVHFGHKVWSAEFWSTGLRFVSQLANEDEFFWMALTHYESN